MSDPQSRSITITVSSVVDYAVSVARAAVFFLIGAIFSVVVFRYTLLEPWIVVVTNSLSTHAQDLGQGMLLYGLVLAFVAALYLEQLYAHHGCKAKLTAIEESEKKLQRERRSLRSVNRRLVEHASEEQKRVSVVEARFQAYKDVIRSGNRATPASSNGPRNQHHQSGPSSPAPRNTFPIHEHSYLNNPTIIPNNHNNTNNDDDDATRAYNMEMGEAYEHAVNIRNAANRQRQPQPTRNFRELPTAAPYSNPPTAAHNPPTAAYGTSFNAGVSPNLACANAVPCTKAGPSYQSSCQCKSGSCGLAPVPTHVHLPAPAPAAVPVKPSSCTCSSNQRQCQCGSSSAAGGVTVNVYGAGNGTGNGNGWNVQNGQNGFNGQNGQNGFNGFNGQNGFNGFNGHNGHNSGSSPSTPRLPSKAYNTNNTNNAKCSPSPPCAPTPTPVPAVGPTITTMMNIPVTMPATVMVPANVTPLANGTYTNPTTLPETEALPIRSMTKAGPRQESAASQPKTNISVGNSPGKTATNVDENRRLVGRAILHLGSDGQVASITHSTPTSLPANAVPSTLPCADHTPARVVTKKNAIVPCTSNESGPITQAGTSDTTPSKDTHPSAEPVQHPSPPCVADAPVHVQNASPPCVVDAPVQVQHASQPCAVPENGSNQGNAQAEAEEDLERRADVADPEQNPTTATTLSLTALASTVELPVSSPAPGPEAETGNPLAH